MRDPNRDRSEPIPEADALEQELPVEDDPEHEAELPDEVPDDAAEGDALEQATPVPGSEDEDTPR
ncbi:MAG TPA: hypothetical protein VG993_01760 [Actinomycetota bacterium]|jgi:hypothetical protein|nr:hypothetical protein [Actinomycetota bacterium]